MEEPGEFEPVFKMNRLGPTSATNLPLPVKFRPVFYDPSLAEVEAAQLAEESDESEIDTQLVRKPAGKFFFKDPLCPPDVELMEQEQAETEDSTSDSLKLGRNMRASHDRRGLHRHRGIQDLMNERKRLLEQQKQQQLLHNKNVDSEQAAATLVNDLIQNGFHISPPDVTPRHEQRPSTVSPILKSSSSGDEEAQIGPVEENKLVVAMHRELKRVQGSDGIAP